MKKILISYSAAPGLIDQMLLKKYSDFIENVIICKRIEFLSDYIKTQNLSQNYIDYIDNLLNSLYKTRLYLVKNIT